MQKLNDSIVFKFTRKLIVCNRNPNDFTINIEEDEMNIIFLWGNIFIDNDIAYTESNKGFKLIEFDRDIVWSDENPCEINAETSEELFSINYSHRDGYFFNR